MVGLNLVMLSSCGTFNKEDDRDAMKRERENYTSEQEIIEQGQEAAVMENISEPDFKSIKAYADKIEQYESEYGIAEVNKESDLFSYMTGLCFMKLVDFSHTGQEELLLVYQTNSDDAAYRNYIFEIWGFLDKEMTLLDTGELFGTDGGVKHVYLTEVDGKTYLVTGGKDSFGYYYYHGYANGKFGVVRETTWDINNNGEYECYIDKKPVSYDVLQNEEEKWFTNVVEYNLNFDCDMVLKQNEETKQALAPYYHTKTVETENKTKMGEQEIYAKLVEHYKKGTPDSPGDSLTVMEGQFYDENQYSTSVRCGVPGNASASQMLYDIVVDATTGEVTQTRVLVDNQIIKYNLNDE